MRYAIARSADKIFYPSLEQAKLEAEGLCEREQTEFLVMKVVGSVSIRKYPTVWEEEE